MYHTSKEDNEKQLKMNCLQMAKEIAYNGSKAKDIVQEAQVFLDFINKPKK